MDGLRYQAAQLPAIVVVESGDGHMGNGDNGDSASLYQGITLMVVSNNAQAGDRITVILAGRHGADVAWSTGKDFATSAGINLRTSGSSSVPVSTFSITNEVVTFILAPSDSGSQTAFTMTAYLAASPDVTEFELTLSSDEGSQVSAALPMQQPEQLGPSPTIFDWSPY